MMYGNVKQFQLYDQLLIQEKQFQIEDMVLEAAKALYKHIDSSKKTVILCGHGNNGADGLALGLLLKINVSLYFVGDINKASPATLHYLSQLEQTSIPVNFDLNQLFFEMDDSDIIVDAIFGTGFKGSLADDMKNVVEYINLNKANKTVISVDIPSGMNGDLGTVDSLAVMANKTITFMANKIGFLNPESKLFTGNVFVENILYHEDLYKRVGFTKMLEENEICSLLKTRLYNGYKGTYGKLHCLVGSEQYPGAALLSVGAALHTGCGFVSYHGPDFIKTQILLKYPEVIFQNHSDSASAILFGCGKGWNTQTYSELADLVKNSSVPLLIDADGINCLSENVELLDHHISEIVLTPHIGEMKRLWEGDSVLSAIDFARKYNVVVVLKGANTMITDGKKHVRIPSGNKAMAVAGMGDCLSGIIASLLAQHYDVFDACCLGVYIHGLCGNQIALNNYTVLPSNLIYYISNVMNDIEKRTKSLI